MFSPAFVFLFYVCVGVSNITRNLWTDSDEIIRIGRKSYEWYNEQLGKVWAYVRLPFGSRFIYLFIYFFFFGGGYFFLRYFYFILFYLAVSTRLLHAPPSAIRFVQWTRLCLTRARWIMQAIMDTRQFHAMWKTWQCPNMICNMHCMTTIPIFYLIITVTNVCVMIWNPFHIILLYYLLSICAVSVGCNEICLKYKRNPSWKRIWKCHLYNRT